MKNPLDRAARYFGIGLDGAPKPRRASGGSSARTPRKRRDERPVRDLPARRPPVEDEEAGSRSVAEPPTTAPADSPERAASSGASSSARSEPREASDANPAEDPAAEQSRSVSSRLGMSADPETEGEPDRLGEEDWEDPDHQPVAARSFSGRTLLLLLIVVALVVPLAKPVHTYFSQKAEVTALRQDISRLQSEQKDLKDQKSRWDSDDYVREQARERLYYVQPGDVPYVVTGQDGSSTRPAASSAEAATGDQGTWGQNLWQSVAGGAH